MTLGAPYGLGSLQSPFTRATLPHCCSQHKPSLALPQSRTLGVPSVPLCPPSLHLGHCPGITFSERPSLTTSITVESQCHSPPPAQVSLGASSLLTPVLTLADFYILPCPLENVSSPHTRVLSDVLHSCTLSAENRTWYTEGAPTTCIITNACINIFKNQFVCQIIDQSILLGQISLERHTDPSPDHTRRHTRTQADTHTPNC